MHSRYLKLGIAALLLCVAVGESSAERRARRSLETTLLLRAAQSSTLAGIEVADGAAASAGSRRLAVSDFVVRLATIGDVPLTTVLGAPDAEQPRRGAAVLTADFIVAAGGRILIEERTQCGPWSGNVAVCRAGCEGGTLALMRQIAGEEAALWLVVGASPADEGDGVREGMRLGACRDGERDDWRLVPRRSTRRAEIELVAR